jgi:organic radical activating enzyme
MGAIQMSSESINNGIGELKLTKVRMILCFSGGEPFLVVEPKEFVEEVNRLVRNAAFVVCGNEAVPVLARVSG